MFGFYKGAASPISGCALYSATLFLSYGQAKLLFDVDRQPTLPRMTCAGLLTGFCAALVEGPVELVKSKMQVQYGAHGQVAGELKSDGHTRYKNSFDCARQLIKARGFRALYQGLDATLARNMPGSALYFSTYELLRRVLSPLPTSVPTSSSSLTSVPQMSVSSILIAGGISGVVFWLFSYPMDSIKSRMQTDHPDPHLRKYKGFLDCGRKIYAAEGWRGFWKGFSACLVRAFPVNAATFLAFETTRKLLG